MKKLVLSASIALLAQAASANSGCGGDFQSFKNGLRSEALLEGISESAINKVLNAAVYTQSVIDADRKQGVFKLTFSEFTKRVVREDRLNTGAQKLGKLSSTFDSAERDYGIPGEVITAFWGLETDFGGNQGSFNTASALVTLAHDCRRPELFRPQVFGVMRLTQRGDINPAEMQGAWAGEIGQVQMLPNDILKYGVDGDNDGHVTLKKSSPDAILSAAKMLASHGWQRDKPWVQEISISDDKVKDNKIWMQSGLTSALTVAEWEKRGVVIAHDYKYKASENDLASLVAPQGMYGPKFLVYSNYKVFLEWNQSFTYTLAAAHLANMFTGVSWFDAGNPTEVLSDENTKALQRKLHSRGHDVGKIDGIIGGGTRNATRREQRRLGIFSDGWPTIELLNAL